MKRLPLILILLLSLCARAGATATVTLALLHPSTCVVGQNQSLTFTESGGTVYSGPAGGDIWLTGGTAITFAYSDIQIQANLTSATSAARPFIASDVGLYLTMNTGNDANYGSFPILSVSNGVATFGTCNGATIGASSTGAANGGTLASAFIALQYPSFNTNTVCWLTLFPGNTAGTLQLTDIHNNSVQTVTVSATQPATAAPSSILYLGGGGCPPPAYVQVVTTAVAGVTTYYYQIIPHSSHGAAPGVATAQTITSKQWSGSIPVGPGIGGTQLGSITAGNSTNTITWAPVPNAVGYDVLRSTNGTTWTSLILAASQTTTSYVDSVLTGSAYTITATDASCAGSDSNSGTSSSPYLTMSKATTVATSGQEIAFVNAGAVWDSTAVTIPAGVIVQGLGRQKTFLCSNETTANICYVHSTNDTINDLTEVCDFHVGNTQRCAGVGTINAAALNVFYNRDNFYSCNDAMHIEGATGSTSGVTLNDCELGGGFTALNLGVSTGTNSFHNINCNRDYLHIPPSPRWSPTSTNSAPEAVVYMRNGGAIMLRDCVVGSSPDTSFPQVVPSSTETSQGAGISSPSNAYSNSLVAINTKIFAPASQMLFTTITTEWLQNTEYDTASTFGNAPTSSLDGTFVNNPIVTNPTSFIAHVAGDGIFPLVP